MDKETIMKFVCLGYMDESKWNTLSKSEQVALMEECFCYDDELRRGGHFLGGEALQGVGNAVSVRFENGRVAVTDGPYAETKEHLGGILLLGARDLNHAIQLMSKHPGVRNGTFEIRPADEQINALIKARGNGVQGKKAQENPMEAKPQQEHQWLERLVGEWSYELDCQMGPDAAPSKATGCEVVRSIGGLWTVREGEGEMPGCGKAQTVMTLGFDPQKQRFVGTFIASMMTHLWIYEGTLDASGKRLVLDTEGPNCSQTGMARFQDIVEIVDDDHRMLSSQTLGEDGEWHQFMTGHYRRKK